MIYNWLRPLLFRFDPEKTHHLTLNLLSKTVKVKWAQKRFKKFPHNPTKLMGINFPNQVGLAAGLDKNAECLNAWQAFGFGFIELGAVTPTPQPGNPKPRLFRLEAEKALINRFGFNNHGVEKMAEHLSNRACHNIVGVNIGKNKNTPLESAIDDYKLCYKRLYNDIDYAAINISSPNTPDLRKLLTRPYLESMLDELKNEQSLLADTSGRYVPLVVKLSPDLNTNELTEVINIALEKSIDGLIISNTTTSRAAVSRSKHANELGGLSGSPLYTNLLDQLKFTRKIVGSEFPIIAAGGIMTPTQATSALSAGANLIQLYTGLIYKGPRLIKQILSEIMQP